MGQYFEIWNIVNMMEHIEALKVHQTDLMMWCWSQIESNYQLSQHWGSWRWFAQNTSKFEVPRRGDTAGLPYLLLYPSHLVIIFGGSHFSHRFVVFFSSQTPRFEEDSGETSRFAKRNRGRRGLRSQDGQRCAKTWLLLMMLMEEILHQLGCIKPCK